MLDSCLLDNECAIDTVLCPEKSFDIIKRRLVIGGRKAVLYFIDGFIKDEVYEKILEYFLNVTEDEIKAIRDMKAFVRTKVPYVEAEACYDSDETVTQILSGPSVLLIDGVCGAALIDTRTYPTRSIDEPQKDKTLRGARDGFVETLISNTAMLRRRIRDSRFRVEYVQVGRSTKLDLAVAYIDGVADQKKVKTLMQKLKSLRLDGLSMTQEALSESLLKQAYLNPFPRFKFTERPDYAGASVMEGKIILLMDNSPCAMILPTTLADFFKETDDYYFLPAAGTYNRLVRLLVVILTVYLTPFYLWMVLQPNIWPDFFSFLLPQKALALPLFAQLLVLELIIDGLRLASINTPDTLSNSLGIIGGLLLSEFAVEAGWLNSEAILFMAFVSIASYAQPSYEMGYAMKFQRILFLILVQLFGGWGLLAGTVLLFAVLLSTRTLFGWDYLYPIWPFNARDFYKLFVRNKAEEQRQDG